MQKIAFLCLVFLSAGWALPHGESPQGSQLSTIRRFVRSPVAEPQPHHNKDTEYIRIKYKKKTSHSTPQVVPIQTVPVQTVPVQPVQVQTVPVYAKPQVVPVQQPVYVKPQPVYVQQPPQQQYYVKPVHSVPYGGGHSGSQSSSQASSQASSHNFGFNVGFSNSAAQSSAQSSAFGGSYK